MSVLIHNLKTKKNRCKKCGSLLLLIEKFFRMVTIYRTIHFSYEMEAQCKCIHPKGGFVRANFRTELHGLKHISWKNRSKKRLAMFTPMALLYWEKFEWDFEKRPQLIG